MTRVESICLIDGKNFAFRNSWTRRNLTSRGRPTSLLFGGMYGLLTLIKHMPDTAMVFVWDGMGKTWRHEKYPDYKGNRKGPPNPAIVDMHKQLPLFKNFLGDIGIRNFEVPNLEADDLIGILVSEITKRKLFDKVIIHSNDKDMWQLLDMPVSIFTLHGASSTKRWIVNGTVEKELQISQGDFIKYKALMGDHSDNIQPMVPGIGPATAIKMIQQGLDKPMKVRGIECSISQEKDTYRRNLELCKIIRDCKDKNLPFRVGTNLHYLCKQLSRKRFLRRDTEDMWEKLTVFMRDYDMDSLMEQRSLIHRLP